MTPGDASQHTHNYLQHPAVITMDWVGFIVLFGSSFVLVYKLMSFKGQANQPESYFFGCAMLFLNVLDLVLVDQSKSGPCEGIGNQR
jgi:hypothetical protein